MSLDFNVHNSTPCMFWIRLKCVQTHHSFQEAASKKIVHIFLVLKWILYPWINATGCWKVCNILPNLFIYMYIYIYINIPHCTRKLIKTDQFNEISANIQSLDVSCKHAIEIVCLYTIILWSFKGKPVNRFIVFVRILSSVRFNSLIFNLPVLREKKRMFLYHGRSTGV